MKHEVEKHLRSLTPREFAGWVELGTQGVRDARRAMRLELFAYLLWLRREALAGRLRVVGEGSKPTKRPTTDAARRRRRSDGGAAAAPTMLARATTMPTSDLAPVTPPRAPTQPQQPPQAGRDSLMLLTLSEQRAILMNHAR